MFNDEGLGQAMRMSAIEADVQKIKAGNEATIKQQAAEIERLSALCDKWNSECDDMREDNKRLANELIEQQAHNAVLREAIDHACQQIAFYGDQPPQCLLDALASTPADSLKEYEQMKADAEKWREHERKKQDLLNRGFLKSPLRAMKEE